MNTAENATNFVARQPKDELIELLLSSGAVTFGDFTTKSGRKTPYFINFGKVSSGMQLARLGYSYASAIVKDSLLSAPGNVFFGPAYKGIPIVTATAASLAALYQRDYRFCFNRKEAKDHGEGGELIGTKLEDGDRVVILEDVTTAGTSIRETVPLLRKAAKIELAGLLVGVDRQEKGSGEQSALVEIGEEFNMPVKSLITITEIVEDLYGRVIDDKVVIDDECMERIEAYWSQWKAA